jgi:PleD family two-component response regulator
METEPVRALERRTGAGLGGEKLHMTFAAVAEAVAEQTHYHDQWFSGHRTVDPSKILVVDADLSRGAATAALVHSIGLFETRRACSARAALSIANDFLPGVVLLSTDLPELASYSLASALHRHSVLASARLIALTADICATNRGHALAAGFEQYLVFPVQQLALERILLPGRRDEDPVRRRRLSPDRRHH